MANKEPYDAGDEHQVRQRKNKADLIQEQETEDLKRVLATKEGRNVLWRILGQGGIYDENPGGDLFQIGKQEGRRGLVIWLLQEIFTANPNAYTIMRNEAEDRST